jgi:hypothetical protein
MPENVLQQFVQALAVGEIQVIDLSQLLRHGDGTCRKEERRS